MPHAVLNEDWSDYDDRKIRDGRDRSKFACTEPWEVTYLVNKLKKHYPYKTESAINTAIESCCKSVGSPHPREKFVECVTTKLDS